MTFSLRKGMRIKVRGREVTITGYDWKNGHRIVDFDGDPPGWCYRAHIEAVQCMDGTWVKEGWKI